MSVESHLLKVSPHTSTTASSATAPVGVLLINLGTPDAPTVSAVRRYLKQFLLDPRVVDLPALARYLLVYGAILPFRPFQSAKAYQEIWTKAGSPLLTHSVKLAQKLQESLPGEFHVALGMRYGQPSIQHAVSQLRARHCQKIIVLPMFPQYSSAATGSALEEVMKVVGQEEIIADLEVVSDFFAQPDYIAVQASLIRQAMQQHPDDFLVLSYHGLPERQVQKSHPDFHCDLSKPCPSMQVKNRFCYRAQCYETSRQLATSLGIEDSQYLVTFQSRLGRVPWIKPYLDEALPKLYEEGKRNIVVACPSFVADCLETIEEIGMRAKEQWQELGGERFTLVPCLNADDRWVATLNQWILQRV